MDSLHSTRFSLLGRPVLLNSFGADATYVDPDGTVFSALKVRRGKPVTNSIEQNGRVIERQSVPISVDVAVLASPKKDGRFNIGGDVWTIDNAPELSNGGWTCNCSRLRTEHRGERRSTNV